MLVPERKEYEFQERVCAIHKARVNVKSLMAEAKIIRHEEARAGSIYRSALSHHRRCRLREESRYAGLALAYLRQRKYEAVEGNSHKFLDVYQLASKISRMLIYSSVSSDMVTAWVCAGHEK